MIKENEQKNLEKSEENFRQTCYKCFRPKSSCICEFLEPIKTKTIFVILMHLKEFRKCKNKTGHFTHLNLRNSLLFVGEDFSKHAQVNELIKTHNAYILYPSKDALNLSKDNLNQNIEQNNTKNNLIFILDGSWPCSRKMLKVSKNLASLPKLSFDFSGVSRFGFKTQPSKACLCTMESVREVLKALNDSQSEKIDKAKLKNFLNPFLEMVKFQVNYAKQSKVRYK